MENRKKCLLIDGNNLVYRSYYAAQRLGWLGEHKEIYIFLKIFLSLFRKAEYQKLFIVFDRGKQTFRNEIDKDYKSNRTQTPDELIKHLRSVQRLIRELGLHYWDSERFEADDLIASFVKKFAETDNYNFDFHIFSQDKDLFQLVASNVKLLRYKESRLELFTIDDFQKIFNFSHLDFRYYLALIGDKADNIKGVKGIGEKRASYLVTNFKNVEETFLQLALLPKELKLLMADKREQIESNIKMISLVEDIKLEDWSSYDFSRKLLIENPKLIAYCKQYELVSILSSLRGTQNRTRTDTE